MYAARNHLLVRETLKVLVMLAAITALALLVFTKSLGATPLEPLQDEPATLPPELTSDALPMPQPVQETFAGDAQQAQLERALKLHRAGELNEAVIVWSLFRLPQRVVVWQDLATAAALLELGSWEEAAPILENALELYPDNPAVHYYQALYYLELASRAGEWNDAIGPTDIQLAGLTGPTLLRHPRSFYELLAMQELELTLSLANNINWEEPLVDVREPVETTAVLKVADLMEVLGAKSMEANAHNVLGDLYLAHGNATLAETHMDEAVRLGACVFDGYRELGTLYTAQGRHLDAARAYAKAIENGDGFALPTQLMLKNLWKGMFQEN